MPDCLCAVILLPVTLPMPIGKYQHQVQRYRPKQAANKWKPEANAAAASAISPEEKDLLHALRAQHGAYPRVQDPRRAHEANIVDRVTENAGRTEQLLARQEALRNIDAGTPLMFGNAPLATKLILGGLLLHSVSSTAAHVNLHSRLLADHGRSIAPSAEPEQTPGASDTGSDEAPDEQTAGTSVPESQSTNVQQFKPAHFEQALQAPANATTANSEQVRSKRESSPSAGKLSIPLPWGSKRPSSFSQHMLGEAPTREIVYRMAIKLNGQDPDQKYVLTDRWQTFSQNMLTANLRVNQTKTHVELALDAPHQLRHVRLRHQRDDDRDGSRGRPGRRRGAPYERAPSGCALDQTAVPQRGEGLPERAAAGRRCDTGHRTPGPAGRRAAGGSSRSLL